MIVPNGKLRLLQSIPQFTRYSRTVTSWCIPGWRAAIK